MYLFNWIVYVVIIFHLKRTQSLCGRRLIEHSDGLILNGFTTHPGDWPWHAAIYTLSNQRSSYICGGTLVSHNSVLTAGHCVYEENRMVRPERFSVELGKYYLRQSTSNQRNYKVKL